MSPAEPPVEGIPPRRVAGVRAPGGVPARVWLRVALGSWGGPERPVAAMRRALVDQRAWIDPMEFRAARDLCRALPGPEAQQLAVLLGWRAHGARGALLAGLSYAAAGSAVAFALVAAYAWWSDARVVGGALFGVRAAAAALALHALSERAREDIRSPRAAGIACAVFLTLALFGAPVPVVALAAALAAVLLELLAPVEPRRPPPGATQPRRSWRWGARLAVALPVCLLAWLAPLWWTTAALGPQHVVARQAVFFAKNALVAFGGTPAALAYLSQQATGASRWLAPDTLLEGIGLAYLAPGFGFPALQLAGLLGAWRDPGALPPLGAALAGAGVATWAASGGGLLWMVLAAARSSAAGRPWWAVAARSGLRAAAAGAWAHVSWWLAAHFLFAAVRVGPGPLGARMIQPRWWSLDLSALLLSGAALLALAKGWVGAVRALGACAALGVLLRWALGVL